MRVVAVNTGSSSLKLSLVEDGSVVSATTLERWAGEADLDGMQEFLSGAGDVDAIGHRVVHGGPHLSGPVAIDDAVLAELAALVDLAPLHQPRAISAIRLAQRLRPDVPAVACFDTAFHATLSPAAATYALPAAWNERWRLRRYGFHGLSHAYAVRRASEIIGHSGRDLRIVSCHLGAGASLCAVVDGHSVDTTMGFTPLAGLVMATRSGSVDPGMLLWLLSTGRVDLPELADVLEHRSGLAGLSGTSGDMRDVLAARAAGDAAAALAYDVFVHRLVGQVAAMVASAGGLDVLVLTGGIGEHSPEVRRDLTDRLQHLGVRINEADNDGAHSDKDISLASSTIRTVVVTAAEDKEIATEVETLLKPR